MTLISVIIPVYNGMDVIGPCLDSLKSHGSQYELEIIAVDDCSLDGSCEFLISKYPGLTILRNDINRGYAVSVNRGINRSHGEYILLLNQDTEVKNGAIGILTKKLLSDPCLAAVAPRLLNPDGTPQKSIRRFPKHSDIIYHHLGLTSLFPKNPHFNRWKMADFDYNTESHVEQPAFSAVLIRRTAVDQIGLLDPEYPLFFNDVDYCKRLLDAGWRILYAPVAEVVHHGGQAVRQQPIISIYTSHAAFVRYLRQYHKGIKYLVSNLICTLLLVLSSHLRAVYRLLRRCFISKP